MIFIHLSQSSHVNPQNTVPLITWYQDAAFRFVIHRTNERKNFWAAAALLHSEPGHQGATYSVASGLGDPPPWSLTHGRGRPWCLG
jgi:hypothetical protein